ncbi:hypothetical protein CAEBREN_20454 [Caenorhabditis brenneri]|uniref:SET domain-containing protein n=1 Tax=Caenorhabditis brenneri TaxID=135651 RepID=G0MYE3_CAEBE|nr:hypothetical protein CAEBREN_20454 [Caenorhabditis brenneri]
MGYNYLLKRKALDEDSEIEVDQPRKQSCQIDNGPPAKRRRIVRSDESSANAGVEKFKKNFGNYKRDWSSIEHSENVSEMIVRIKEQCHDVQRNDQKLFRQAEQEIRQQISNDPILKGRLQREAKPRPDVNVSLTKCFSIVSAFILQQRPPSKTRRPHPPSQPNNAPGQDQSISTSPRRDRKRVQLLKNITTNLNDPISVFDHVASDPQTVEHLESITFLYTDRNILTEKLKDLDAEFEKPENKIRCNCHTKEGGYVKCWKNPSCPCYQMNMKLRNIQVNGDRYLMKKEREGKEKASLYHKPTNFSTFEPHHFNSRSFWYSIGFACSEECSCKGCCSNNSTYLVDKKINRLEIFRESFLTGFGVRTLNFIPAGTVVCEFTGEMIELQSLDVKDFHYAFEIVSSSEKTKNKLITAMNAKGELKRLLEKAYTEKAWFLNSKKIGNVPRCFNHSCEANTTTVRVFQKGFSPSHIRFLVVTTEDVFPGEELTFHYGEEYLDQYIPVCGCGKKSCVSKKNGTVLSEDEILEDLKTKYEGRFRKFKETVLDQLQ